MTVPVDTTDVPQLSMIDELKMQHAQFSAQKDAAQTNLNQLVGAIYATELTIKKLEAEAAKELSQENLGDTSNGEAKIESTECAPQE